jgi:hypothetical protein
MTPLQELQQRLAVIRDLVRGVAERHYTGCCFCGRPDTSTTYAARTTLNESKIPLGTSLDLLS